MHYPAQLRSFRKLCAEVKRCRRKQRMLQNDCRLLLQRLKQAESKVRVTEQDGALPPCKQAKDTGLCMLQLMQTAFDSLSIQIWYMDEQGKYIFLNQAHADFYGFSKEQMQGQSTNRFYLPEDAFFFDKLCKLALVHKAKYSRERWVQDWTGKFRLLHVSFLPASTPEGGVPYVIVTAEDITKRKENELAMEQTNKKLTLQSLEDELTKVPNRRCFNSMLRREWGRYLRMHRPLALLLIDIDHFKEYNDTYGHLAGDRCLAKVAKALKRCASRSTDFLCRFGGEEFTVILPDTGLKGALCMAEKLRRRCDPASLPFSSSDEVTDDGDLIGQSKDEAIPH